MELVDVNTLQLQYNLLKASSFLPKTLNLKDVTSLVIIHDRSHINLKSIPNELILNTSKTTCTVSDLVATKLNKKILNEFDFLQFLDSVTFLFDIPVTIYCSNKIITELKQQNIVLGSTILPI